MALLIAAGAAGCTNASLSSARKEMATGNYALAHQHLIEAQSQSGLSRSERREVNDSLCAVDFKIGAPQYPLAEQYRVCAAAAADPRSLSRPVLAEIEAEQRRADQQRVESALAQRDLADAQTAMISYSRTAGADPALIAAWSARMWKMLHADDLGETKARRRLVAPTIAVMARRYPGLRAGSDAQFEAWVRKTANAGGTPLISGAVVHHGTLKLWLDGRLLGQAALNLDRFVSINDGLAARCGCDARTDVGVSQTGLPVYMVKLDPFTRGSEVLVLPRP